MDDRCGWCIEGGHLQCVYPAGHSGLHKWGALPPWAFDDAEDYADYQAWLQTMPPMPSHSGCEIQAEEVEKLRGTT
jgi:hypothetical protein